MTARLHRGGYMLMETLCAMAVLSITTVAIHAALRQAAATRAQARDFTQARFLLQERMSELEMQAMIPEGERSGRFEGELARFSWATKVDRVKLPAVELDATRPRDRRQRTRAQQPQPVIAPIAEMGRLRVTVRWSRAGQDFSETIETLAPGDKLSRAGMAAPGAGP